MNGSEKLKEKISSDLKVAQKNRDELQVSVLRMLLSDIHNREIAGKKPAVDEDVLAVLNSTVKKHKDAVTQFQQGNRPDLVDREQKELLVLEGYLPQALPEGEVREMVRQAMAELTESSNREFGQVMKAAMAKLKGRASGGMVSEIVKEELK